MLRSLQGVHPNSHSAFHCLATLAHARALKKLVVPWLPTPAAARTLVLEEQRLQNRRCPSMTFAQVWWAIRFWGVHIFDTIAHCSTTWQRVLPGGPSQVHCPISDMDQWDRCHQYFRHWSHSHLNVLPKLYQLTVCQVSSWDPQIIYLLQVIQNIRFLQLI